MRDFDTLLPRILTRAVQVPEPAAIDAIRESVVDLCEQARVWAVDDDFPMSGEQPEIMFVPSGALLFELAAVTFRGKPLKPASIAYLTERYDHWLNDCGAPAFYTQREPNTLWVVPSQPGSSIHIRAYLKPSDRAEGVPGYILDQHREVIADGALARLLAIPDQPWSNPQLAAAHGMRAQNKIDAISSNYLKGQQSAPLRTRPSFF